MNTISIRLSNSENELIKSYAKIHGISISELTRRTLLEKTEEEYDLKVLQEALADHRSDSTVYSHNEVKN